MRIEHPDKKHAHLSLWLGLVGVIVVLAGGYFYFEHSQAEKTAPGTVNYLRPVPSDAKLRSTLSDAQYHVTRENGTETAFQNLYWDNFKPGIYVDVITYEPLFSSRDKFDSKTGRPSFTKPIAPNRIEERMDTSFNMQRTEIRAIHSNSHLGHLFKDGPAPTGLRYAVNSAALHFVPLEGMEAGGYKDFVQFVTDVPAAPTAAAGQPGAPAAQAAVTAQAQAPAAQAAVTAQAQAPAAQATVAAQAPAQKPAATATPPGHKKR